MAKIKLGNNTIENALFLACASQASYVKNPAQSTAYKKTDLGSPVLIEDAGAGLGDTGFIASTSNAMVIALRGTDDIEDWLRNLNFEKDQHLVVACIEVS